MNIFITLPSLSAMPSNTSPGSDVYKHVRRQCTGKNIFFWKIVPFRVWILRKTKSNSRLPFNSISYILLYQNSKYIIQTIYSYTYLLYYYLLPILYSSVPRPSVVVLYRRRRQTLNDRIKYVQNTRFLVILS